jgi:hypothetical protein
MKPQEGGRGLRALVRDPTVCHFPHNNISPSPLAGPVSRDLQWEISPDSHKGLDFRHQPRHLPA